MNKLNLPKFYVGQKVVAVKDHEQGMFKKGQEFKITGIRKSFCGCDEFLVTVGIIKKTYRMVCSCGKRAVDTTNEMMFLQNRFAPIQQQKFPLIKLSKIMEKEKEEILIEN